MKKIKAKKLVADAAAIGVALSMTSCAYLDESIFSVLESAASSQSTAEDDSSSAETVVTESSAAESEDTSEKTDSEQAEASESVPAEQPESNDNPAQTVIPETDSPAEDSSLPTDYNVNILDNKKDSSSSEETPDVYEQAQNSMYISYAEIISDYSSQCAADPSYRSDYCGYLLFDIDGNNVPELLIQTCTCEADRTIFVYSYDGNDAVSLGSFVAWHSSLGYMNNTLYSETSAMGTYTLYTITINDGIIAQTKVDIFDESQLTNTLEFTGFTSASGISAENLMI